MAPCLLVRSSVPSELIPVAVVLTSFDVGGTEQQIAQLIRRLDKSRFRVHVACFRKTGPLLPRVEEAAFEVAEFPLHSFKSPRALYALRSFVAWLRQRRIAIVQTCDRYANIFALPGATLAGVPVRIGSRRELSPPDQTRAHAAAQQLAYRCAHRVVANSKAAAAVLIDEGLSPGATHVISNGVDLSAFASPRARGQRRIVATIANLREGKGHYVLLRAIAPVIRRVPDVRLRLIGDGPLRHSLARLAEELGIAASVEFLGHREDVPSLLATSDICVLPSWSEAFPNGLIEGMAAGLPVVATSVGGMLELVEHANNGLLVPPRDEAALARAIDELIDRPAFADMMAAAARRTIETRYSFERMVTEFEQLYFSQLAVHDTGRAPASEVAVS